MKHLKRVSVLSAIGGSLLFVSLSHAGLLRGSPVVIDVNERKAYGSMGFVYNSPDNTQHIGCTIEGNRDAFDARLHCTARDINNVIVSCFSDRTPILSAAQSIGSDSFVTFTWDLNQECLRLSVTNESSYIPKETVIPRNGSRAASSVPSNQASSFFSSSSRSSSNRVSTSRSFSSSISM
jgi:hypothetical protein